MPQGPEVEEVALQFCRLNVHFLAGILASGAEAQQGANSSSPLPAAAPATASKRFGSEDTLASAGEGRA